MSILISQNTSNKHTNLSTREWSMVPYSCIAPWEFHDRRPLWLPSSWRNLVTHFRRLSTKLRRKDPSSAPTLALLASWKNLRSRFLRACFHLNKKSHANSCCFVPCFHRSPSLTIIVKWCNPSRKLRESLIPSQWPIVNHTKAIGRTNWRSSFYPQSISSLIIC